MGGSADVDYAKALALLDGQLTSTAYEYRQSKTWAAAANSNTKSNVLAELRFKCMVRHYDFYLDVANCLSAALTSMMSVDSGCQVADESAQRYGCLCRRRFKYTIISTVPPPSVDGKNSSLISSEVGADVQFSGATTGPAGINLPPGTITHKTP